MTDGRKPTAPLAEAGRVLDPRGVRVTLVGADLRALPPVVLEPAPVADGDDARPLLDGDPEAIRLDDSGSGRAVLHEGEEGAVVGGHRLLIVTPDATAPGGRPGVDRREVIIDGWRVEVEVESASRAALQDRARRGREEAGQSGPTRVHAIIPGVVVSVSVATGDVVTAGQQLLVVEAMKMQNELRSPRDGTVAHVAVGTGAKIDAGDLLLVLA